MFLKEHSKLKTDIGNVSVLTYEDQYNNKMVNLVEDAETFTID